MPCAYTVVVYSILHKGLSVLHKYGIIVHIIDTHTPQVLHQNSAQSLASKVKLETPFFWNVIYAALEVTSSKSLLDISVEQGKARLFMKHLSTQGISKCFTKMNNSKSIKKYGV